MLEWLHEKPCIIIDSGYWNGTSKVPPHLLKFAFSIEYVEVDVKSTASSGMFAGVSGSLVHGVRGFHSPTPGHKAETVC